MVILSALPKLDVFQIAEGLNHRNMLARLYTGFASGKNRAINRFVSRRDSEQIPPQLITDLWFIQLLQHYHKNSIYNDVFDLMVASLIRRNKSYKALLAWSGMAEHSLVAAKQANKFTVLGRESCHIAVQNKILTEECRKYGIAYKVDDRITRKELREYKIADKIYVCSSFVKRSFLENDIPEAKIFVNPIAVPAFFTRPERQERLPKFIILFLGKLTIRKGLRYLFEALEKVNIPANDHEAWFIGATERIVRKEFESRKRPNWKYLGFVPQGRLPEIVSKADVGVFPSLEDGFAQVVPQQLACGLPVITTSHTGSSDFIRDGHNGFVVPPFNSDMIAEKIELIYNDSQLHERLRKNAQGLDLQQLSPDTVAARFADFFNQHL